MPKGTYLQPINLFGYTITCIDLEGHYVTFYVNDITFAIIYNQAQTPTFEVPTFEKDW